GPGSACSRHSYGAGVGDDAGRDRPDVDRHQRVTSGTADQRPKAAIAPGRERGGTSGQRRSVRAVAPHLRGADRGVSLRRLTWSAKLSVASRARIDRGVIYLGPVATEELERRQRWLRGTA